MNAIEWHRALLLAALVVGCSADANGADDSEDDGGTVTKGDDLEDDEPPPPPPDVCQASCMLEQECLGGSLEGCLATCATDHGFYASSRGSGCVQKFEGLLQCVGALDCTGAIAFADGYAEMYPCEFEEESFVDACILQGDPPPAACVSVCAKSATCAISDVSDCEASCTQQISWAGAISEGCGTAQTDLLVCAEALECAELTRFYEGDETLCAEPTTVAATACAM